MSLEFLTGVWLTLLIEISSPGASGYLFETKELKVRHGRLIGFFYFDQTVERV